MHLTDKDIKMFQQLSRSMIGKNMVEYLSRLKTDLFNPAVLTPENFLARKDAVQVLDEHIIRRIAMASELKSTQRNEYE